MKRAVLCLLVIMMVSLFSCQKSDEPAKDAEEKNPLIRLTQSLKEAPVHLIKEDGFDEIRNDVINHDLIVVASYEKIFVVNMDGSCITEMERIGKHSIAERNSISGFNDAGYAVVSKDGKKRTEYFLMDKNGIPHLKNKYDYLESLGTNIPFLLAVKDGKGGVIDYHGNIKLPFVFKAEAHTRADEMEEGATQEDEKYTMDYQVGLQLARDGFIVEGENRDSVGMINFQGETLLKMDYRHIEYQKDTKTYLCDNGSTQEIEIRNRDMDIVDRTKLKEGLEFVSVLDEYYMTQTEYEELGVIDKKGKTLLEHKFSSISDKEAGHYICQVQSVEKRDLYLYDDKFRKILKTRGEDFGTPIKDFLKDGVAIVSDSLTSRVDKFITNGKAINLKGEPILPSEATSKIPYDIGIIDSYIIIRPSHDDDSKVSWQAYDFQGNLQRSGQKKVEPLWKKKEKPFPEEKTTTKVSVLFQSDKYLVKEYSVGKIEEYFIRIYDQKSGKRILTLPKGYTWANKMYNEV